MTRISLGVSVFTTTVPRYRIGQWKSGAAKRALLLRFWALIYSALRPWCLRAVIYSDAFWLDNAALRVRMAVPFMAFVSAAAPDEADASCNGLL